MRKRQAGFAPLVRSSSGRRWGGKERQHSLLCCGIQQGLALASTLTLTPAPFDLDFPPQETTRATFSPILTASRRCSRGWPLSFSSLSVTLNRNREPGGGEPLRARLFYLAHWRDYHGLT